MRDAIIARPNWANKAAVIMLALVALFGFVWGYAHAEEPPELSPSVVLLPAQTDTVSAVPTTLTIDAVLDKAIYVQPAPTPSVSAKPSLTLKQRATFIVPTPSNSWKASYGRHVVEAARSNGVPPELVMAVIAVESGFNPNARNGTSYGLMQIKLPTAQGFGLERGGVPALMNPVINIRVATNYLGAAWKLTNGNVCATVSRYNRGLGSRKISADYCAKVARIMRYADFQIE